MRRITHKTFMSGTFELLKLKSYETISEEVRKEAEEFIATVGADNVVSVTENNWHERFAIVVWYSEP